MRLYQALGIREASDERAHDLRVILRNMPGNIVCVLLSERGIAAMVSRVTPMPLLDARRR